MGGYGSGYRINKKTLVEDLPRVDVLELNRKGLIHPCYIGSSDDIDLINPVKLFQFSTNDELLLEPYDEMAFSHATIDKSNNYTFHESRVIIEWVDCRYGGKRPYFKCPDKECNKRVQHIYLEHNEFRCRHCMNLSYKTQRNNKVGRMFIKMHKAYAKVGVKNWWYDKQQPEGLDFKFPKGMHKRTQFRIQDELVEAYKETNNQFPLHR